MTVAVLYSAVPQDSALAVIAACDENAYVRREPSMTSNRSCGSSYALHSECAGGDSIAADPAKHVVRLRDIGLTAKELALERVVSLEPARGLALRGRHAVSWALLAVVFEDLRCLRQVHRLAIDANSDAIGVSATVLPHARMPLTAAGELMAAGGSATRQRARFGASKPHRHMA